KSLRRRGSETGSSTWRPTKMSGADAGKGASLSQIRPIRTTCDLHCPIGTRPGLTATQRAFLKVGRRPTLPGTSAGERAELVKYPLYGLQSGATRSPADADEKKGAGSNCLASAPPLVSRPIAR